MVIRRIWRAAFAGGLALGVPLAMSVAAAFAQTSPRLVRESTLVRQGSFTLPAGLPDEGFEWGGTALTYNPANASLFIVGHDWNQYMAEIAIPPLGGTATVLQALRDPSEGRGVGEGTTKVGGSLVYQGVLWFTKYLYYDAEHAQTASHFSRPISLSTTGQVTGPLTIGSIGAGFVSGYLGHVPADWQSVLGGTVLTGNCCLSIISRTSYGPAASAWTPGQTSATPLVHYTIDHQTLGTYGAPGSNPVFNGSTRIHGIVFPAGTDSVLFFGRTGTGNYCYGTGAECGDPVDESRGEHAYPYRMYVWAYNAFDLAAVRAGSRQPWDVVPYAVWDLGIEANSEFSSHTAYDPGTNRIFVSQVRGDGDLPLIHVFSVAAAPPLPTLTPSPAALNFGAINNGGTLTSVTPPQTVTLQQSAGTGVAWTASTNVSWATISVGDAAGTGTGTFTVSLNNTGNVLPATGTVAGTITITAPGAASNPTIPVRATLYAPSGTVPPFGQVDTPAQNAAGVQGAIGVTGWALDDVAVDTVRIYRPCFAFENQAACQVVAGHNLVFVGGAAFLAGARPDLETAFSTRPLAHRAGWGFLLLTNMLPHVTNAQAYGGQGSLSLYAYATDREGQVTLLGRTYVENPPQPTAITLNNDAIAKPFGAIDTPGQGVIVSGLLPNFGWALTPDSDTVADATDILIPSNGSTMFVFLDSVATAAVAYNHCRGDVGTPPAAGVFCNDDVSQIFGNPTPQPPPPPFTTRTANQTRYRNLDAGRGAIGAYNIDTTAMANGLHTIAWSVTDSAGRTEGIGSRFFQVLNAGARDRGPGTSTVTTATLSSPARDVGALLVAAAGRPGEQAAGRVGFDLGAPFVPLTPDAEGIYHVRLGDLDRLELDLGPVMDGYLDHHSRSDFPMGPREITPGVIVRRALPIGATLDTEAGIFAWAPPPGYVGTYRLAFGSRAYGQKTEDRRQETEEGASRWSRDQPADGTGADIVVDVTIAPREAPAPGEAVVRMHLDAPAEGATLSGPFTLAGWALDPQAGIGTGIGAVHVWAQRTDVANKPPVFLGAATLDVPRPDVARAHGTQFTHAGFHLTVAAGSDGPASTVLPPGLYTVTVYVWNTRTARWEDARTLRVSVR